MKNTNKINNLIRGIKTPERRIGFFDLETKYSFRDFHPDWEQMPSKRKKTLFPQLVKKLKLAIAGILVVEPKKRRYHYLYFEEKDINKLKVKLNNLDLIIGHNLTGFDYRVLATYFSPSQIQLFERKTIDTFKLLHKATGQYIALDDLGKLNLDVVKTTDSWKIPGMWRAGQHREVKSYLKRDLEITAGIFAYALKNKKIMYPHKHFGKFQGNTVAQVNWYKFIEPDIEFFYRN